MYSTYSYGTLLYYTLLESTYSFSNLQIVIGKRLTTTVVRYMITRTLTQQVQISKKRQLELFG
jgi:hypothetical protein